MTQEYPENFARFYDLIYLNLRDGVDNGFFLNEINNSKGKVLETGTGTGSTPNTPNISGFSGTPKTLNTLSTLNTFFIIFSIFNFHKRPKNYLCRLT